jgi:CxxC motif-containing protein
MRTITTTVKCQNGEIVSVKTKNPIPKEKIFEAMKIINKSNPVLPISIGDVIIEDVFGSPVIATGNAGGNKNGKDNSGSEK